jgi:multicomponent Na+:H+ antiporter subunit G
MVSAFVPWLADALVLLGLVVLTTSVWGILRMPDLYTSLHASSKAAAFGIAPLLIAAGLENQTIMLRGLLVLGFLLLTSPVSSHAIARAHWRGEKRASRSGSSTPEAQSGQQVGPAADL